MCGYVAKMKYFKGKYLNHSTMLYVGTSSHFQIAFSVYLCGGGQGRRKRSGWSGFGRITIYQGENKIPFCKK